MLKYRFARFLRGAAASKRLSRAAESINCPLRISLRTAFVRRFFRLGFGVDQFRIVDFASDDLRFSHFGLGGFGFRCLRFGRLGLVYFRIVGIAFTGGFGIGLTVRGLRCVAAALLV